MSLEREVLFGKGAGSIQLALAYRRLSGRSATVGLHERYGMKVRGTTSFSVDVDAAVTHEAIIAAVQQAVQAFREEYAQIVDAKVEQQKTPPNGDMSVDLNIVFRSGSYAEVEQAMNDLAHRLNEAVTVASGARVDGHETQLVPA